MHGNSEDVVVLYYIFNNILFILYRRSRIPHKTRAPAFSLTTKMWHNNHKGMYRSIQYGISRYTEKELSAVTLRGFNEYKSRSRCIQKRDIILSGATKLCNQEGCANTAFCIRCLHFWACQISADYKKRHQEVCSLTTFLWYIRLVFRMKRKGAMETR